MITCLNLFSKKSLSLSFIDRILTLDPGVSAECLKVFSYNESYFQGHFKNNPVVPGTILIECMLQASALVCNSNKVGHSLILKSKLFPLIIFKRSVIPGDELVSIARIESDCDGLIICNVKSNVDGLEVCSGVFHLEYLI
jgi:3-hydroxymyristoyl/3-hydroxydecanoyl-(acyl carrier protein) dehydratase